MRGSEGREAVELREIDRDRDLIYLVVITMKDDQEAVMTILKQYGYTPTPFKDFVGTAAVNRERIIKEIQETESRCSQVEKEISTLYKMKYGIECVYDQLVIERDREKVKGRLLKTKRTFNLEGWVPEPAMEVVDKMLTEYQCCFAYRDPEEGDEVPVLTQNNSVVYPFESITEMYSLPDYKGVDPTKYFAFFYAMFFGIMLSDAGYGIVIALACFIVLRKFALEGMTYKMIKMFFYCGLSTILWGALFGGWFGDFFQVAAKSHIWQRDYHTGLVVQPDRRSDQAFDLVPGIRRDSHLPGHGHQSGHADQRRQMAGCGLRRLLLVFSHTGCSHVAGRKLHIRSSGKAGHVWPSQERQSFCSLAEGTKKRLLEKSSEDSVPYMILQVICRISYPTPDCWLWDLRPALSLRSST